MIKRSFRGIRVRSVLALVVVLSLVPAAAPAEAAAGVKAASVSAASFGLESLGGVWPAQKAAVVTHPGRIDAFLVGWDHQLYHYVQVPGSWFQLRSLGGSLAYRSVAAVSWDINNRDVFAIGTDNQLHHYYQQLAFPFQHEVLGGNWASPGLLEAVSGESDRIDVFVTGGPNPGIGHYWWPLTPPPGAPFGFEMLSGATATTGRSMSVTAWPGRIDVVFLDSGDRLLHAWQNAGDVFRYEWMSVPSYVDYASVDSVSWAPYRLDVFMSGWNGNYILNVQHYWQDPGGAWGRETVDHVASYAGVKPVAAVTWGQPRLDLFVTHAAGGGLYHLWQDNSPFRSEALGGSWNTELAAVSWGPGRLDVFAIGNDQQLYHYWQA